MKFKYIIAAASIGLLIIGCKGEHKQGEEHNSDDMHVMDGDHHDHSAASSEGKSIAQLKKELTDGGYQIFDYVDPDSGDTVIMQQYFMAFLKQGPNRDQDSLTAANLQKAHLEHLGKMYAKGYADISGPFGDDGEVRGITIYNVPTLKMADSLANSDPMVKAGRLVIEIRPWWAAKGFLLR